LKSILNKYNIITKYLNIKKNVLNYIEMGQLTKIQRPTDVNVDRNVRIPVAGFLIVQSAKNVIILEAEVLRVTLAKNVKILVAGVVMVHLARVQ
jgi:hypothetical protein